MINIKRLLVVICLGLLPNCIIAQENFRFEGELARIKNQLDFLSESNVPGLNELATLSVSNMPIQTFLRSLAQSHKLNIQIDPAIIINVTNNFTEVPVKDLIYFMCREYQLSIRFTNSILSIFHFNFDEKGPTKKKAEINVSFTKDSNLISFDLSNDTLKSLARVITKLTGTNVLTSGDQSIEHKLITLYIKDLPLESALEKLAYTNGLRLIKTRDGVFILEMEAHSTSNAQGILQSSVRPNGLVSRFSDEKGIIVKDSLIYIDVVNFPIMEIVKQVSEKLGIDYILFSDITGNTTMNIRKIEHLELFHLLFQGTSFTYKFSGNVVSIGQRAQEGFKSYDLVKLRFRTIDGIEKEIPSELLKDVELKILKELNSLVLTGNRQKIDEILSFVTLIDKPIPNILIEVIVVDARKGFNLQTGLQAFISRDSTIRTSGQIFSGTDVTLSSNSINNILDNLDSKGVINLGRVTPAFYSTLKFLEQNNNIQIRSTPKLATINGNKATLLIGESKYYVEQTQNITGGVNPITTTSQRFNKVEANLSISISPLVSGNEHVTLDISAEFSNFVAPTIVNAPPGNTTRKFESKIRIRNEDLIVLGGLEEVSKSDNGSGTPILSRIPIIKWLFSSRSKTNSNNRLIVFIKPTIVY